MLEIIYFFQWILTNNWLTNKITNNISVKDFRFYFKKPLDVYFNQHLLNIKQHTPFRNSFWNVSYVDPKPQFSQTYIVMSKVEPCQRTPENIIIFLYLKLTLQIKIYTMSHKEYVYIFKLSFTWIRSNMASSLSEESTQKTMYNVA